MLTRLAHPKWLGGLALATLFAVACYFLGQWQWSRYEEKSDRNATLDRNFAAEPVAFAEAVGPDGIRPGLDWARVELTGTFAKEQIYVRNRPNDTVYGYEIVGILRTPQSGTVAVTRGWVQNSREGAAVLPAVPDPPPGPVTVVGWVRPYERSLGRELPAGQVASIARAELADASGAELAPAFVRAQSETAAGVPVDSGLLPMEPPDRSLGPHQAYALQWWLTMVLGYAFVVLGVRRELREERAEQDPVAADAAARRRSARKRTSRWDEEDS